ncbi:LPS export ABC transporter periplasmic protein LptC [Pelomonas sp. KK5]|uniref:LPS export ABC transporter periplasmic protein LptC n=1 Tax=Pelomonas sp. KK5 TaxID=1855730 RepID=UPI0009F96D8D|nr:LPS export ABC transporter periplasmic protein LptC [Pelomonas sp. KK5]
MATTLAPPPAAARARVPVPWLWRLQSLLSAYLPLLLMAALAGGTWWLVKNTPSAEDQAEAPPPRHEPDYRMNDFSLERVGANGLLRGRIEGRELRHYPDTDTLEIDEVRLRAIGTDGSLTLATARRGVSNSDGSDMQLYGDVLVQRFLVDASGAPLPTPQLVVRGEFLQALSNSEQLRSHLPVTIDYGGAHLQAQTFLYDHLHALLNYSGRTTGRFDVGPNGRVLSPAAPARK